MTEQAPLTPQFVQQLITEQRKLKCANAQTALLASVQRNITYDIVRRDLVESTTTDNSFGLDCCLSLLSIEDLKTVTRGPVMEYLETLADKRYYAWEVRRTSPGAAITFCLTQIADQTV